MRRRWRVTERSLEESLWRIVINLGLMFKRALAYKSGAYIVEWLCPPHGTLKLHFDGSFLRSTLKGGIGGVIKNWNEEVVKNFYVHVVSLDTNEAKAYALLIRCRELERIEGTHPFIEGDSVLTIQWASRKASYPWRIADWKEV